MSQEQVRFAISPRARQYGYLIWPKGAESSIRELLGTRDSVRVVLNGRELGDKRIDWRYHRVSLGPKATRDLPVGAEHFVIALDDNERLVISTTT